MRQSQITFYGESFTTQGMKSDPAKIQALQYLPTLKIKNNYIIFRPN